MQKVVEVMGTVTLRTVAEACGVSVSTVSNAYNKPDQLSAEARQRILETAKELGYAGPNPAARTLRSQRAGAIGLLFTEQLSYAFSDPYSVGMLAGLSEVAEQFRTGLLLVPLPDPTVERVTLSGRFKTGVEKGQGMRAGGAVPSYDGDTRLVGHHGGGAVHAQPDARKRRGNGDRYRGLRHGRRSGRRRDLYCHG